MASKKSKDVTLPLNPEKIIDIDVSREMRGSFLEYAYSVIYSRALPDARDGLKPVQRRILYQMNEELPDDLQVPLEELENSDLAKSFVMRYHSNIKSAIVDYRQRLMNF